MMRAGAAKGIRACAACCAGVLFSGPIAAQPVDPKVAQALSDQYFCSACHANDRTMVGPPFIAIAKKYKGDAAAPAQLAAKVKSGGQGVWGNVPMPPNPTVKDNELQQLIAWILSLE